MTHGAHPRSRGEHSAEMSTNNKAAGSSPLARGTPIYPHFTVADIGLIPARAGNTTDFYHEVIQVRAHPRSRGEHKQKALTVVPSGGSSPLARGTHKVTVLCGVAVGLIPARAGNTKPPRSSLRSARAHPRSRGEHLLLSLTPSLLPGSSPLARGTLIALVLSAFALGLIPARAGNTTFRTWLRGWRRAHPRSRGEHTC